MGYELIKDLMLIDDLIKDEKKNDRSLYSSGPYWDYKNSRAILEIKKKGIEDFRGLTAGIGTSFSDNEVLDIRNEYNIKGRIIAKLFSLPLLSTIFNAQLRITKNHINKYLSNKALVYQNDKNVHDLLKKYKFENTTEFGCISSFKYLKKNYSCHYLEMADRINNLSKSFNFNDIFSYFEIGGGFGANIHFLISNFSNIKKILYLDAVPNIYVGTQYLRRFYKDNLKDYMDLKDRDTISFSNDNKLEILCIPPWSIERVEVNIDHFHNASSFVEMPKKVIENYVKFIRKFKTKEISLISYNSFNPKTTFNPEDLNNFFDNELKIYRKNTLIEGYDRKLIYLTSN